MKLVMKNMPRLQVRFFSFKYPMDLLPLTDPDVERGRSLRRRTHRFWTTLHWKALRYLGVISDSYRQSKCEKKLGGSLFLVMGLCTMFTMYYTRRGE